MTLDLATLFESSDGLFSTGPCRYASDWRIKSLASSNVAEFLINSSNFVSLCDFDLFEVTNSYRTFEKYCKRKLYKVSVVIAVKTRAFQIETKFSATAEVDNLLQHDTLKLYIKDLFKS